MGTSTPNQEHFRFGGRSVSIDADAYYDMIFDAPFRWCEFLLEHDGWQYLDHACFPFHYDHVEMLAHWAVRECEKLPEEIRHPVDGTVRDLATLIRFLAAALSWKVANRKFDAAHIAWETGPPSIDAEEAVHNAAQALIDAALDYPPPYRDVMVRRSLAWTDFVERAWMQGLNIPTPWGTPRHRSPPPPTPQ